MGRTRKADSFLSRNLNAVHLFVGATLVLPGYLFQTSLFIRILQVLLFAWLATVNGKRIKWIYFVIMVTSISFFHTLRPFGEVLLRIGPYTVTRGALHDGLMRGFTIVGLVFISLFSIRPDLKLPGRLGGLLARVFWYFERVFDNKKRIRIGSIVESIDEILESLFDPDTEARHRVEDLRVNSEGIEPATKSTARGFLFLAVLLLANWALVFVEIPFTLL